MTDEEKKAIEDLKEVIDLYNDRCLITTDDDIKSIDIVLNLIEKQFKKIEELKAIIKILEATSLSFNEIQDRDKKWKDKIKAKIEEFKRVRDEILREEKEFNIPMTYDLKRNDYCEKMLQSLLEGEE